MKRTKLLAVAISIGVISSAFIGCGVNKEASVVDPNEKIDISWLGIPNNPSAQEGTFPQRYLEEKFNVNIKPIFLSGANFKEKKAMLMASNEIPDVIYELDPSFVVQDSNQGFIMELPYDTIKKYAPTVFSEINKESPLAWVYSMSGDKNYGVPNLNYINAFPKIGMWRTDWLKNVGIDKIPETIDEMHTALYKFANNDPNKNGKKDTYGMTTDVKQYNVMFTDIFGAFGVMPFNWMKVDGKPVYGGLMPETKQTLALLAQWYKEGIIHPDFVTDGAYSTGKDKFVNGVVGFMNVNGGYMDPTDANSTSSVMKQINSAATIANCKPIKGNNGQMGKHAWGKPTHIVSFGIHLQKQPAKVGKILTMLEAMITDEDLAAKIRIGEKDKHWTYKDDKRGLDGGIKFLPPFDDRTRNTNECFSGSFGASSFFAPVVPTYDTYLKYQAKEIRDTYDEYANVKYALTDTFGKPDTLPSSLKYFEDLKMKQMNLMIQIIVGEKSVDAYSEFENIWKSNGGSVLDKEALEMDTKIVELYKKVGVSQQ